MKLSRIIRQHRKDCRCKGSKHEWSGILKSEKNPYYGNFAANPFAERRGHMWYVISCNDPQCEGEKAVHSSVLADA